ncbi:MAG: methionyl-tRNA formyltransferase [Angelakisella sp.]
MRIVFMGTPDFAVPCLQRLIDDGHQVVGVFTQPDKPKGRGYTLAPPPVKELAVSLGIPVYQPTKLRDGTALALLRELAPELIVVVAYGRILPKDILDCPPLGCINIHGSLLPKYRGAAPIQWTVLNGDKTGGVTSMYMAEGMDTGDMILRVDTPIGENETSGELYERLAPMGANCLSATIRHIETDTVISTPQNEAEATTAPMLDKAMGQLNFLKPANELHNLIRGLNPWPSAAITTRDGKMLKLHRSTIAEGSGKPGEILDSKRLIVACGEGEGAGALELTEVQPEGKGRMNGGDYMRGARLQKGDIL